MFDAFQYRELAASTPDIERSDSNLDPSEPVVSGRRRPVVETLYDVFFNIREDEAEHASTMKVLQRDATLRSRGLRS